MSIYEAYGRSSTHVIFQGHLNGEIRAFKEYHLSITKEEAYKYNKEEALRCANLRRCVDQFTVDALSWDVSLPG